MPYLVDTSILTRLINLTDAQHAQATEAVRKLFVAGEALHITAQNLIEFWAVATRPVTANGLGMSIVSTAAQVARFRSTFAFLEDAPSIYQAWQLIVIGANVEGKQTHDARLAAVAPCLQCASRSYIQRQAFSTFCSVWRYSCQSAGYIARPCAK